MREDDFLILVFAIMVICLVGIIGCWGIKVSNEPTREQKTEMRLRILEEEIKSIKG